MSWKIEWHPRAAEEFEALPRQVRVRIIKRVDKVEENPFHFLEHFEGRGLYKLRIGDYRALVAVDFGNKIITIQMLDHRGGIYKRI